MPEIKMINPKPSFVIKAKLLSPYGKFPLSTKIFINVLTDPIIPKPESDFNPVVTFPMIMENKWEIPIYITANELKTVLDKKGVESIYMNCIINDACMRWCLLNKELLTILMEWCIESIEFQFDDEGLMIDRDSITTPKLSYKGDPNDIVDLEIDLDTIRSVNKIFEDGDLMVVDTSEPKGIIEMKKLEIAAQQEEDDEELISVDQFLGKPSGAVKNGKRPLIEIIDDMKISPQQPQQPQQPLGNTQNIQHQQQQQQVNKPKLSIDVTMTKLQPSQTLDDYKLLIKFKSKSDEYNLQIDQLQNELQLTTTDPLYSKDKSLIKLPLPLDINGEIKSFFNTTDFVLYVYVK